MKKLLMICGLLFGVITLTHAQDGGRKMMSPEDRAKKSTEKLAEKLKLTEDQKAKVLAIYTQEATSMNNNMEQNKADWKAKREEMKAARVANDAKIEAVLTNDQKKTYEAMIAERKAAMEKRASRMGDRADKKQ